LREAGSGRNGIRSRSVTREEALEFLRRHQPLPPDGELSEETITAYDAARRYFLANPDNESIALFLYSFGDGSGFGVYQLVEDVIAKHHPNDVVPILSLALQTGGKGVKYWGAQIAERFPDSRLLGPLAVTLSDPDSDIRSASALAIACIGGRDARALLGSRLEIEDDSEVRESIAELLTWPQLHDDQ